MKQLLGNFVSYLNHLQLEATTTLLPPTKAVDDNPNDNRHLSTTGMAETLVMSFFVGFAIMVIFEKNRFFKQIYLKRLQNRFRIANRVPPYPQETILGWFWQIQKVSEKEILRMVGLDAYMCLRYIVVCYKLSIFLSFWGLIVLLPLYSTVTPQGSNQPTSPWDKYTISNVGAGDDNDRHRLWFASIFAYMFSAYFCQLLYAEYNHFSVKRLHFLVQKEADGHVDPDTPPQKSFTVMIERIPSHLRSAQALFEYFEKLFPGDVYTVEIALDLKELDSKNAKRKRLRDKLEKAVAYYEAKNERLKVYARTGHVNTEDTKNGIFGEDGLLEFIQKSFAPDKFGYELVDALSYYTNKLLAYNQEVKELQERYYKSMTTIDKDLQRKFAQRYDTRFAAMFESVTYAGAKALEELSTSSSKALHANNSNDVSQSRKQARPPRPSMEASHGFTGATTTRPSFSKLPAPAATTVPIESATRPSLSSAQHPFIPQQHQPSYANSPPTSTGSPQSFPQTSSGASKLFSPLPAPGARASKIMSSFHLEDLLFGPTGNDYRNAYEEEMVTLQQTEELNRRPSAASLPLPSSSAVAVQKTEVISNAPTTFNPIHTQQPFLDASERRESIKVDDKPSSLPTISEEDSAMVRELSSDTIHNIPVTVEDEDDHSSVSDVPHPEINPVVSSLLDDRTIQEWMKKSSLEAEIQPLDSRKRGPSYANVHDSWRKESQAEMQAYLDASSGKRPANAVFQGTDPENSKHGDSQHFVADQEVKRASALSAAAKLLLLRADSSKNESKIADSSVHSIRSGGGSGNPSSHGYDHRNQFMANRHTINDEESSQHHDRANITSTPPLPGRDDYYRTPTGGLSSVLPTDLNSEQLEELTKLSIQRAKILSQQTLFAGKGAWKALLEIERSIEMLTVGAYYKYSSTAFVTFNSRVTESIAQQMLLSPDAMEINHAPNPKDIIWENVAIPKSQIVMRTYVTNIGVVIGSVFWSSLVNSVNIFASFFPLPKSQQQTMSAVVLLVFLLCLPFAFDTLARYYEGYKLESEIQNSIMTRYFYYQLINVYVTVGFSGSNLWLQLYQMLQKPATIIDVIGGRLPNVSMFFANLMIVKIFLALPLEMVRPWQLSTILLMSNCMDRRKSTRRDLRTGAFYSWPMLYGWIYPQLMMVLMIMVTYSCITPLLMPFCTIFFAGAYIMYKYQLLYVYINEYQSGGYMWYAVFNRSLIALEFASVALIGYLSLQLSDPAFSGPFFILLPLPVCLMYFGRYCDHKLKKASENLSYGFARQLDAVNDQEKKDGSKVPHDSFSKTCYRQPSLTEPEVFPEPYRNDGTYDILTCKTTGETVVMADWNRKNRVGSISINVEELLDEGEENPLVLQEYWKEIVLPLSVVPESSHGSDGNDDERRPLRRRSSNRRVSSEEIDLEVQTRSRR